MTELTVNHQQEDSLAEEKEDAANNLSADGDGKQQTALTSANANLRAEDVVVVQTSLDVTCNDGQPQISLAEDENEASAGNLRSSEVLDANENENVQQEEDSFAQSEDIAAPSSTGVLDAQSSLAEDEVAAVQQTNQQKSSPEQDEDTVAAAAAAAASSSVDVVHPTTYTNVKQEESALAESEETESSPASSASIDQSGSAVSASAPTPTPKLRKDPKAGKSQHKPRQANNDNNSRIVTFARTVLTVTRILVLDLPLAFLFASWVLICLVRHVHHEFYVPLFERATRTNAQLQQEFTYYERQCTEYDISTHNIKDMLIDTTSTTRMDPSTTQPESHIVSTAVHQMLQHGGTVIPHVLKPDTVQALREYVVRRNAAVTAEEQYPMSQGERRLSYGVDASEDVSVATAVAEVAHHPLVRPLVATLLGDDDPASAEITVITAYYGAEHQVWHQDTKQDGNAIKFARTYSHSYSLFVSLQNTTALMGATDLVPGTHMCANDIEPMCDRNRLGLHLVGAFAAAGGDHDSGFPAGHGALLNQHVWHRGGAHTDPSAPERIVLVLSFVARPRFDVDPRQLSRGTYFHQKWLMWGHTWKDLLNPLVRMRRPFSILRCLSLWKPAGSSWGYDLITSGFMRVSNEQLEYEDFEGRFLPRLDQLRFPESLRGRHIRDAPQKITWTVFIRETFDNLYVFLGRASLLAHGVYSMILFLVALGLALGRPMSRTWVRWVRHAAFRVAVTHGFVLVLALALWQHICHSKWGRSVSSGTALMRPFPSPDRNISITELSTMLEGPTTLPTRNDVLVGTRYDADFLGSYNLWLDYHPGNAMLVDLAKPYAAAYATYRTTGLKRTVIHHIVDQIQRNGGRFLGQDYLSGDWVVLNARETEETVAAALLAASREKLASVLTKLNRMIADQRFGPRRERAMAKASQIMLWHLRQSMIRIDSPARQRLDKYFALVLPANLQSRSAGPTGLAHFVAPIRKATDFLAMRSRPYHRSRQWSSPSGLQSLRGDSDDLRIGSLVWCAFDDLASPWFPGTIMEVDDSGQRFSVSFEDGSREDGLHRTRLRQFTPIQENDRVEGCFAEEGLQDCYPGTVLRVWPSGFAAILYDDGEYDAAMHPTKYFVPPYRYEGPFPY